MSSIAAVQARIGAIQMRLGVTPRPPVGTEASAGSTAVTASAAPAATAAPAASPSDAAASFATVLEQADTAARTEGSVGASTPYADLFNAAGERHGVPARVLAAIGWVESRYRTDAVSSAGATGMMQFMPATAESMGVDPSDPASAIDGAARYLRSALDRFDGDLVQAIASYNVGVGAVARSGVQPGSQAERYSTAVLTATGRIS